MIENNPKRILLAPLDWGLGHTTRCTPLISYLQQLGHTVVVAGNEWQRSFLHGLFPGIETIHLEGYNVTYSLKSGLGATVLLRQVPGIYATIKREHLWLKDNAPKLKIDAVISDNRYGLYHPELPSVIITHQLQLQTGAGKAIDRLVQQLHYRFLDRFQQVWVPDLPDDINLGGKLSHTDHMPGSYRYFGLLSQFADMQPVNNGDQHLLVLLSGPEPQRSVLSAILWNQLALYKAKVVFIAGSESAPVPQSIPDHIQYYRRLSGGVLATMLQNASLVVCRSGYSTLMDLVLFQKKAIIIPTPGQTEQEYLARHLNEQGIFIEANQSDLNLTSLLDKAETFPFKPLALGHHYHDYKLVLEEWLG